MSLLRRPSRAIPALLEACDVQVGGSRPWDIRVLDASFYLRVALNPAFEVGETYMDGLWECDAVDALFYRLLKANLAQRYERGWQHTLRAALARLVNRQSRRRAEAVADAHYNLDLELFEAMLDVSMNYTCAFWNDGDTLDAAQINKMQQLCDRLQLREGDTLLDIGCGFGGLAGFAARRYGARVTGITNSRQHYEYSRARYPIAEFILGDYRELPGLRRRFDKIVSVEMIEAVGPRNFSTFMQVVRTCLGAGGVFVLQSFIADHPNQVCNPWFDRYIFPNGVSPSLPQLDAAAQPSLGERRSFTDIGTHYAPTLLAWDERFRRAWPALRQRHSERFYRMWRFYLTCAAGFFRAEALRIGHLVYRVD